MNLYTDNRHKSTMGGNEKMVFLAIIKTHFNLVPYMFYCSKDYQSLKFSILNHEKFSFPYNFK